MGGVLRCFSKGPGEKVPPKPERHKITESDKAKLDLKKRIREIKTRIKKLEERSADNRKTAILEAKAGNKRKGVMALKMKKMHDVEIEKAMNIQFTLESTIQKIEESEVNVNVYEVLKEGDRVLKDLDSKVSLPDLEDIYENQQERNEVQQEIADFMTSNVLNEGDFEDELNNLEEELEDLDEVQIQNKIDSEQLKAPVTPIEIEQKPAKVKNTNERQPVLA